MAMRIGTEMPSLSGVEWLNGDAVEVDASIDGHPTLVHFWSVSCGMCKENLPTVAQWREELQDEGLRVVAIHMPRYPADTDVESVKAAVAEFGIVEPCGIDNEHSLRDAFGNDRGYVPAYYIFDAQQKLRGFAAGERGLAMIRPAIDRILRNSQSVASGSE